MKICTTFLLLLISFTATAFDKHTVDSLQNSLKTNVTDEQFAKTYLAICQKYTYKNTDSCLFYASKTIEFARKGNLGIQVALAYLSVAKSYEGFYKETESLEYFILAMKEGEKHEVGIAKFLCALCYYDIGEKYHNKNEHANAVEYRRKAWNLIQKVEANPVWRRDAEEYDNALKEPGYWNVFNAIFCAGLGTTLISVNELDSALSYFNNALKWYRESTYKEDSILVMLRIGSVYLKKKQYPLALKNFSTVMEIGIKEGEIIPEAATNMAAIYIEMKKYDMAIDILKMSMSAIKMYNIPANIEMYYSLSAKTWDGKRNFELASAYKDSLIMVKDSVYESINHEKNVELKVKFETLEKEKQIQLLKKENELKVLEAERSAFIRNALIVSIIFVLILGAVVGLYLFNRQKATQLTREKETMSAKIEGQDVERQRIAADLHDRLGSMLATVKLYFTGIEDSIEQFKIDTREQYLKATELLDDACDEVRKISHDLASDLLANNGLIAALHNFKETLVNSKQLKMQVISNGLNERLNPVIEVTLYRIVQELTSNVIKHANAENLTVHLTRQVNVLNLVIKDDGVGFDSTDNNYQSGLGLKSLAERVNKLNGKFRIDSSEGIGTTVIIDIPI